MSAFASTFRSRAGIASVEAALLGFLLLVPVLSGAADVGLIVAGWAAATRAQQAGLLYAFNAGPAVTASGVENAALAAYGGLGATPTVTASSACYCLSSDQTWDRGNAASVDCSTSCASGDTLTEFLTVAVSTTVTLPMPLPGFASPYPIAASAVVRLK